MNPYDSPATAAYALTHATDELFHAIKSFNILKKSTTTPVIMITPETGRLPSEGMGQFARYVSGKSGGWAKSSPPCVRGCRRDASRFI